MRDDGVSVKFFSDRYGKSTLRSPEFFDHFWKSKPIDMELAHYASAKENNTWENEEPLINLILNQYRGGYFNDESYNFFINCFAFNFSGNNC
ncbi:MAG: hypothetical protein ACOCQA_03240 [bacterium]